MARLIVALDFPDAGTALDFASILRGEVDWVKVGLQLFISAGPAIVEKLKLAGFSVFLDLKLYDIPNTVAEAVKSARGAGADMLTLHCQGGERMCQAAMTALPSGAQCLLLGVTALTSFERGEMPGICMEPQEYGFFLARCARDWGLPGVVCSPLEAGAIKGAFPMLICVCPGIRLPDGNAGDQRRVATPQNAVAAGADFLVVGRPITRANDPLAAARLFRRLMASNPQRPA